MSFNKLYRLCICLGILINIQQVHARGFSIENLPVSTMNPSIPINETHGLMEALGGFDPNNSEWFKAHQLRIGGAISAGVTYNPDDPDDGYNFPVIFNDRSNEFQLNRFRLFIQRDINPDSNHWDIGGRADFVIGADARYTTALGLDDRLANSNRFNRVAFPQFYAQIFAPYGNGITAQIGHFFTVLGSASPFNSVSYVAYTEPSVHTGILLNTPLNSEINISAGAVLGSLNTLDNFAYAWNNWNFLGNITWTKKSTTVNFSLLSGDDTTRPHYFFSADLYPDDIYSNRLSRFQAHRTQYSLTINYDFAEKWHYKIQHDYGYQAKSIISNSSAQWYGIEQDLLYDVSDELTVGLRGDWFRDQNGLKVMIDGVPATYYSLTAGVFWKPLSWVTIRPELRYDHSNVRIYDDRTKYEQLTFGTNIVIKF